MLHIFHSNRLEPLLEHLSTTLETPLGNPLSPEIIIIQNQGMANWLAIELAKKRSLMANCQFPFPASFIWDIFQSQLENTPGESPFDKEVLTWKILGLLPELLDNPDFSPLANYLTNKKDSSLKSYQLARNIADTLDQYMVYRPDWIIGWEAGQESHWQAQLWRILTKDSSASHRCRLIQKFISLHEQKKLDISTLPERIAIFGISTIPPAYLDIIARLADVIQVNFYLLNPCLSYWGDIVTERDISRLRSLWQKYGKPDTSEYYAVGNSLLASLGKSGRDFQELLHQYPSNDHDLFSMPQNSTLLADIQRDILLLDQKEGNKITITPTDSSLQLHVCHSRMREIEILHDQLLYCFEQNPQLKPQDIIIMAPDINTYAPYIKAVFATADKQQFIPWSIADLTVSQEHPVIQTFLQLIQLPESRFAAAEIISLLEVPAISQRFAIDESNLENIRQWILDSGIRWGESGNPNSWSFGMARMFSGYALPPEKSMFNDILPYRDIEGTDSTLLGQLQHFISQLSEFKNRLGRQHTPNEWVELMLEIIELLFQKDDSSIQAIQIIRDTLTRFLKHTQKAQFAKKLDLSVIQNYLKANLNDNNHSQRFISGQTTFCTMQPMRSIPFKIVCLIGMNDIEYPRQRHPLGFDLMDKHPRQGDRSRREDDRYLFLEALLSARQTFYMSYIGRNINDNSVKNPSVLVSELFEYIEDNYNSASGNISDLLITEHPLQPFNPHYYTGDSKLFSYKDIWLPQTQNHDDDPHLFIKSPLPQAKEPLKTIQLSELIRFFKNPGRFFLKERLGIHLEEYDTVLEENEPFSLEPLQRYNLKQSMLHHTLAEDGTDLSHSYPIYDGQGILPYGEFGKLAYKEQQKTVEKFKEKLPLQNGMVKLDDLEVDLQIDDFTIQGWLTNITPEGLIRYRLAKYKADSDHIPLWIEHIIFNLLAPANCKLTSTHIAEDRPPVTLDPVDSPKEKLKELISYYRQGLLMPLKFFPNSAHEYIKSLEKHNDQDLALKKAAQVWLGNNKAAGESKNPYYKILYPDPQTALDNDFIDTSKNIYKLFQ